eukprot:gene684-731_t
MKKNGSDIGFNNIRNAISSKIGNLRNVENLFLLENYFHSPLPETVGNLTHLRVINLRRANLFGTIPKQLYQCRNLTGINFKFNHLTGSIHTDLGKLVNLVSYDISSNNIFGSIPDSIGELKSLTALVLDSNVLSQTIPGTITQLPLLRDLVLQKNSFIGDASVFTNMTSIRSFYISYNFFSTSFRFYSSEVFRDLIYFSISANLMTGKLPWDGENWGRALFVYLTDKNYFTGELPTNYNSINKLLYFVVESNALWGTVPSNFLQKDNITYFIDLASNYFSGKLPEFFGNKTTLTQILLYENYFKLGKLREKEILIGNGTPKTLGNTEIETGAPNKVNVDADDDEARVSKIELMDRGLSSQQEFVNNPIKPNHIEVKLSKDLS